MSEETLFHEALAKSPAERAAFLDAACAGQPGLRAAVEALGQTRTGLVSDVEILMPMMTSDSRDLRATVYAGGLLDEVAQLSDTDIMLGRDRQRLAEPAAVRQDQVALQLDSLRSRRTVEGARLYVH